MAINAPLIAEKIFNLLKGFGYAVTCFDDEGKQVVDPQEATRFAVANPNILVRLDVANETIRLSASKKFDVEELRKMIKTLAQDFILNFDFALFSKTITPKAERIDIVQKTNRQDDSVFEQIQKLQELRKLAGLNESEQKDLEKLWQKFVSVATQSFPDTDPIEVLFNDGWMHEHGYTLNDLNAAGWDHGYVDPMHFWDELERQHEKNQTTAEGEESAEVMESFGPMVGSSKTSYQPLDNIKIIVKHRKPVNEEVRGARSRNIHSIYVQRGEERFRLPENSLAAARAMARHLHMGGEVHDTVAAAINEMAKEQRQLSEFVRYVRSAKIVNEENQTYVDLAVENIQNIRGTFDKLAGAKTYANAVEHLNDLNNAQVLEDDIDLESHFTVKHFDEKVSNAINGIKRSIGRRQAYEGAIKTAIAKETFSNVRDMLSETEGLDFATPHARLSYQVARLGDAATNPALKNHLKSISKKLDAGGGLSQFDYTTVKSCLLTAGSASASVANANQEVARPASVVEEYERFLEKYIIF